MPKVSTRKWKIDALLTEKYCRRLVTCSFDEVFLQQPVGFLSAVSTRITCENPQAGKVSTSKLPEWVSNPPPLIRPAAAGSQGLSGAVPIPFSITWQRYRPTGDPDEGVQFLSFEEPEVLVIVLQDQLDLFLKDEKKIDLFVSTTRSLQPQRRVSVIIHAPCKRALSKERDIINLIVRLQFEAHLVGVQQASTVQNLSILISGYTKAICQRPFKQNRLDDRHGFSFLPSASAVAGTVAAPRFPLTIATSRKKGTTLTRGNVNEKEALRVWVHRTWLCQLATWRGMTGEVANAVGEAYPTPRALYNALKIAAVSSEGNANNEAIKRFADLRIRRGAGILTTETRLGKAIASRIVAFFTSLDPNLQVDGDS